MVFANVVCVSIFNAAEGLTDDVVKVREESEGGEDNNPEADDKTKHAKDQSSKCHHVRR